MTLQRRWVLKRLLFYSICASEFPDDHEMLHKALLIVGEVGAS
jgi:hypothetical protein